MCCGGNIIKGAVGLSKAGLQMVGLPIDQAPREVYYRRLSLCALCEHAVDKPGPRQANLKGIAVRTRCAVCDCFIRAKATIASETCPLATPRWSAVDQL